jgi:uncharacterized protein YcgI (DUF1989 family)
VPRRRHGDRGRRIAARRDYVEVEALAGVIAVISNCPQKYNPACGYNPTPVRVETYRRAGRGRRR